MFTLIMIIVIFASVCMIPIVLIQHSKQEGELNPLGGGAASQVVGVQQATDLVEQITWGLMAVIIVGSLSASIRLKNDLQGGADVLSPNIELAQELEVPEVEEKAE